MSLAKPVLAGQNSDVSGWVRRLIVSFLNQLPRSAGSTLAGLIYAMQLNRIRMIWPVLKDVIAHSLKQNKACVPFRKTGNQGYGGIVGDATIEEILAGYRRGFFPFAHLGPIKWWYNSHRMVLFFDEAHFEKHTKRFLRNNRYRVTFDQAFLDVMDACGSPRPGKPPLTWINDRSREMFLNLHNAGYAHSVEVWDDEGSLVGGLFGVSHGGVFYTESQFHTANGTSKVAFAVLNRHLAKWGFAMNDGKDWTSYLHAHGFRLISNKRFISLTKQFSNTIMEPGKWSIDEEVNWQGWQGEIDHNYSGRMLAPPENTDNYKPF